MGGCSVRHLELPSNDLVAGTSGHEHPLFGITRHGGLACAAVLAGAAIIQARLGDAGALFHAGFASEGFTAGDGHQAKGQNAGDGCVDGRFCCCRCHVRSPLVGGGGMGVWGAATRSWWPPIVHTDDGLQWMASGGSMVSRPGFLMLVLSCCAYRPIHAPSPQPWRLQALDQLVAFGCCSSVLGDGLFAQQISDRYHQLIRLNRLGDVFLKACRDGTLPVNFASVSR